MNHQRRNIDATQLSLRSSTRTAKRSLAPGFDEKGSISNVAARGLLASVLVLLIYSVWLTRANAGELPPERAAQSLASIRTTAEEFVRAAAHAPNGTAVVAAGELDKRLQFAACAGALQAFALKGATIGPRNTVGVRCSDGAEWTLYIPVALSTDIDVLVLQTAAARETQLAKADVKIERRRVPGLGSLYVSDASSLAHRRLKRSLPAGTALTIDMFVREWTVKRGQQVFLVSNTGGIEVRAPGLALSDGGNADRIRVQNQSSLKVVEGVVESGNLVRVGM